MRRILLILSSLMLTWAGSAAAQDASIIRADSPLAALYACSSIADNTQRLACFDTNVASIQVKEGKKEIVTIDAAAAKSIKKEAFGFSLPSLPKLGLPSFSGDNADGPDELTFNVKSVRKQGRDYVFVMDNGQVWRQANGNFNYIPKGDLTATINAGAIGSFRMSLSNGKERVRGMGVRRVE